MIHALTIRSPVARGSLKNIECPALSDSYFLITSDMIPGVNTLADFPVPILADRKISYIGQGLALLVGTEEAVLEELASQIKISVEEEAPVFSGHEYKSDDIIVKRNYNHGELDRVLEQSDKVLCETYITGIQEHWYSESHGAVAVPSGGKRKGGTITVYTATQWPNHVRKTVADVLGLNSTKVRVNPTLLAVHLDGKIWYPSLIASQAALAASITGSPVKLMLTREEDFLYSPKRNRSEIKIRSTLGEKGAIHSSAIQVTLDLGAEGIFGNEIIEHTCIGALNAYRRKSFTLNAAGIRTNIPPQGLMAGFGLSQGFFASERHVSRIADALGQDPAEWRKNNYLEKSQNFAAGQALKENIPFAELIGAAAAMSDYYRKWASYELLRHSRNKGGGEKWDFIKDTLRGIGIATSFQGGGFLYNNESLIGNYGLETPKRPAKGNRKDFTHPSWAAVVVEIEINPVSFTPLIRGIWLCVDGGKILSPREARRSLQTGIVHALGWTCREQVQYEEGKIPLELSLGYDIPAPEEIPPIRVDFIKNKSSEPKNIDNLPFGCVPAAFVQAVSQAMNHPFEKIPLDARDIWDAWKLKHTESPQ